LQGLAAVAEFIRLDSSKNTFTLRSKPIPGSARSLLAPTCGCDRVWISLLPKAPMQQTIPKRWDSAVVAKGGEYPKSWRPPAAEGTGHLRQVHISGSNGAFVLKPRHTRRYDLRLPVLFSWTDRSGNVQKQGGFTRNISLDGLYVEGDVCPPVGASVTVEVLLPIAHRLTAKSARLVATMRVVRVSCAKHMQGFAAVGRLQRTRGRLQQYL
jgi:hypothetical protein